MSTIIGKEVTAMEDPWKRAALCRCARCKKEMSFLAYWTPPGALLLPPETNQAICGACRRELIASLVAESKLRHIHARDITCCFCGSQFTTTNKKTGGVWLVEITANFLICENCLRGIPKENPEQATPASNESNAG